LLPRIDERLEEIRTSTSDDEVLLEQREAIKLAGERKESVSQKPTSVMETK